MPLGVLDIQREKLMNSISIRFGYAITERIKRLTQEEKGEIGSWLILAAGLVGIAVFAGGEIIDWITNTVLPEITNETPPGP